MTEEKAQEEVSSEENIAAKEERENAEKFYPPEMQKEVDEKNDGAKSDEEDSSESSENEDSKEASEDKGEEDAESSEQKEKIDIKGLENPNEEYISTEDIERIAKLSEERGLSKEAAQMLINERAEALQGLAEAFLDHTESQRSEWKQSSMADKEIGGENIEKTVRRANLFLDKYASPELKELIEAEGFGNHPEVLRFLSRAGASMENDSSVIGGKQPTSNARSIEDIFYPSMKE